MSVISFSGLASGLDTGSWVTALTALKNAKIESLQEEKAAVVSLKDAVAGIKTYFTSFRNSLERLTDAKFGTDSLDLFVQNLANSSNPSKVTATATSATARDTYEVGVTQVATATKVNTAVRKTVTVTNTAAETTKLSVLGVKEGFVSINNKEVQITAGDTIGTLVDKLNDNGITSYYEEDKGRFTIATDIFEADDGITDLFDKLGLDLKDVVGEQTKQLMTEGYVAIKPTTLLADIGATDGQLMINQTLVNMNLGAGATVQDFLDYVNNNYGAQGATATMDADGYISITGLDIQEVAGGSNIVTQLGLVEKVDSVTSVTDGLSYIQTESIKLDTKLGEINTTFANYNLVLGTTPTGGATTALNANSTIQDVKNAIENFATANGMSVQFEVDEDGAISITGDIGKLYISGGVATGLGLDVEKVNGTSLTSSQLNYTHTLTAQTSTTWAELGISGASLTYNVLDERGNAIASNQSVGANTTIEAWFNSLKQYGIEGSISEQGVISIDGDGLISGGLATALGLGQVKSGEVISGTSTTSNALSGVVTVTATMTTTLGELGITSNQTFTIRNGGTTVSTTFTSTTKIQDIANMVEANGGTFELMDDGSITIKDIDQLSGSLVATFGLTASGTTGTSIYSNDATYSTGSLVTEGSKFSDYGVSVSGKTFDIYSPTGSKIASGLSLSSDATVSDLFALLNSYGLSTNITSDGRLSISDGYITGSLADTLGITNSAYNTIVAEKTMVSKGLSITVSTTATLDTTLAELGLSGSYSMTVNYNGTTKGYNFGSSNTLADIADAVHATGGKFDLTDGYVSVTDAEVTGTICSAIGLNKKAGSVQTIKTEELEMTLKTMTITTTATATAVTTATAIVTVTSSATTTAITTQTITASVSATAIAITTITAIATTTAVTTATVSAAATVSVTWTTYGTTTEISGYQTSIEDTTTETYMWRAPAGSGFHTSGVYLEEDKSKKVYDLFAYYPFSDGYIQSGSYRVIYLSENTTLSDLIACGAAVINNTQKTTGTDGTEADGLAISFDWNTLVERDYNMRVGTVTISGSATVITNYCVATISSGSTVTHTIGTTYTTRTISTTTHTKTESKTVSETITVTKTATVTSIGTKTTTVITTNSGPADILVENGTTVTAHYQTSVTPAGASVPVYGTTTITNYTTSTIPAGSSVPTYGTTTITNYTTSTIAAQTGTTTYGTTTITSYQATGPWGLTINLGQNITGSAGSMLQQVNAIGTGLFQAGEVITYESNDLGLEYNVTIGSSTTLRDVLDCFLGEAFNGTVTLTSAWTNGSYQTVAVLGSSAGRDGGYKITSNKNSEFIKNIGGGTSGSTTYMTTTITTYTTTTITSGSVTGVGTPVTEYLTTTITSYTTSTTGGNTTSSGETLYSSTREFTDQFILIAIGSTMDTSLTNYEWGDSGNPGSYAYESGYYGKARFEIGEVLTKYIEGFSTVTLTVTASTTLADLLYFLESGTSGAVVRSSVSTLSATGTNNYWNRDALVFTYNQRAGYNWTISSTKQNSAIFSIMKTQGNGEAAEGSTITTKTTTTVHTYSTQVTTTSVSGEFAIVETGIPDRYGNTDINTSYTYYMDTDDLNASYAENCMIFNYFSDSSRGSTCGNLIDIGDKFTYLKNGSTVKTFVVTENTSWNDILNALRDSGLTVSHTNGELTISGYAQIDANCDFDFIKTSGSAYRTVTVGGSGTTTTKTIGTTTTTKTTKTTTTTGSSGGGCTPIDVVKTTSTTTTTGSAGETITIGTTTTTKTISTTWSAGTAGATITTGTTRTTKTISTTYTAGSAAQTITVGTTYTTDTLYATVHTVLTGKVESKTVTVSTTKTVVRTDTVSTTHTVIQTVTHKHTSTYIDYITVTKTRTDTSSLVYRTDQKTHGIVSTTFNASDTTLNKLGVSNGAVTLKDEDAGTTKTIMNVTSTSTLADLITSLQLNGFDAKYEDGRIYLNTEDNVTLGGVVSGLSFTTATTSVTFKSNSSSSVLDNRATAKLTGTTTLGTFAKEGADRVIELTIDGTKYYQTFTASNTVNDVIDWLGAQGVTASINNGVFQASDSYHEIQIGGALGDVLLGDNPTVTSTTGTGGYWTGDIAENRVGVAINNDTKIVDLGVSTGGLKIYDNGTWINTAVYIGENTTIGDLASMLAGYDMTASLQGGKLVITSDSDKYLSDESSNLVSKLGLTNRVQSKVDIYDQTNSKTLTVVTTTTLSKTTTLGELGFSSRVSMRVEVDGVMQTMGFTSDETIQDVIDALSAYGIDANIHNGIFTAFSESSQFELTGSLADKLNGNAPTYLATEKVVSYSSDDIKTDVEYTAVPTTKLTQLGVKTGYFNVERNGEIIATVGVDENTTVQQMFNALSAYNIAGDIDANGVITVKSVGDIVISDGTSNLVSHLGLDDNMRSCTYDGTTMVLEDEVNFADKDTLVSYFDTVDKKALGSLYFEVADQEGNMLQTVVNITADDTIGSVMDKLEAIGLKVELKDGVLSYHNGLGSVNIVGGSSSLVDTLQIADANLEKWMQNTDSIMVEQEEIRYDSIVNYADNNTKLSTLGIITGEFTMGLNGQMITVDVDENDTLGTVISKISNKTGGRVTASLTDDGRFKLEANPDITLEFGLSIDSSNFVTILDLDGNGTNSVTGNTHLYRASDQSKITTAGLFRLGNVTAGTFKIGNATFTITNDTTIAQLVNEINRNEDANATAYWDNINGRLQLTSKGTGASYVDVTSGTSNFTEIFGLTVNDAGVEKLATYNQKLGNNAILTINGTRIVATSNTITSDISKIEGLTVNVKDVTAGEYVTIKVERNTQALVDAVQETLDNYNVLIAELNNSLSISGSFHGDVALNSIKNEMASILTASATNGASLFRNLASVGISTESANSVLTSDIYSLYLDPERFTKALEESEQEVKLLLVGTVDNPGILTKVGNILDNALSASGYFSTKTSAINRDIASYDKKIAKITQQTEAYKALLERKFNNMENLYSTMQAAYSNLSMAQV